MVKGIRTLSGQIPGINPKLFQGSCCRTHPSTHHVPTKCQCAHGADERTDRRSLLPTLLSIHKACVRTLISSPANEPRWVKLFFRRVPETKEEAAQFKGFILALKDSPGFRKAGLSIRAEDIVEIRSHDHVLAQCLDIVLGAMAFRLNDKHLEKPPGARKRGKRTVAKESLYKAILAEIYRIRPRFNIGISTGVQGDPSKHWLAPYLHWSFVPSNSEVRDEFTKPR